MMGMLGGTKGFVLSLNRGGVIPLNLNSRLKLVLPAPWEEPDHLHHKKITPCAPESSGEIKP